MGTTSEVTEGSVEEDMKTQKVVGFFPISLARWDEIFSRSRNIQRIWKDYQDVIHNTYRGGYIETDHQVACSITEDVTKYYVFPKFTASWPRT